MAKVTKTETLWDYRSADPSSTFVKSSLGGVITGIIPIKVTTRNTISLVTDRGGRFSFGDGAQVLLGDTYAYIEMIAGRMELHLEETKDVKAIASERAGVVAIESTYEVDDGSVEHYTNAEIDSLVSTVDKKLTAQNAATSSKVDTKANSKDVYTKTETDAKVKVIADSLASKADASRVYTKVESDAKFVAKA